MEFDMHGTNYQVQKLTTASASSFGYGLCARGGADFTYNNKNNHFSTCSDT